MGKWVSLKEALMSQSLQHEYGDLTKRQIDYLPALKSVQLLGTYTGWEKVQTFYTEKNHTWYPFIYAGEPYIVAGEVTEAKLWLSGRLGGYCGVNILVEIAELYGNDSLEAKGKGFLWENFKALPKHLRNIEGCYWICKRFKAGCDFGLQIVSSGNVDDCKLYDLYDITNSGNFAMRPLVHLKSNTEVYIDGSDGPLEIRISPNAEEAQEKEEILPNEAVYSISKKELVRLRLHATNVVKIAVANEDQDAYTEAKGLLNLIEQIEKGE